MILLDTALEKLEAEGKPIRVGIIGIGFMGRAIGWQIAKVHQRHASGRRFQPEPGCRAPDVRRVRHLELSGRQNAGRLWTPLLRGGIPVATDDAFLLCRSPHIDVILEVTGAIEFGSRVALEAMKHRKHVVWMNAELMGTLGPILKTYADKAGVILTEMQRRSAGRDDGSLSSRQVHRASARCCVAT